MQKLNSLTGKTYEQSVGREPEWDILDFEDKVYFEVKWDTKSCARWVNPYKQERPPTGNLFIEYENPKAEKKTGIEASISKYWIYVVKHSPDKLIDDSRFGEYKAHAHFFDRKKLLDFCKEKNLESRDTKRDLKPGKTANAKGWLLKWSDVNAQKKESGWIAVYDISEYLSSRTLI